MFKISIITPANLSNPGLAIATARAGATVFFDVEFCREGDMRQVEDNIAQTLRHVPESATLGLRFGPDQADSCLPLLAKLSKRPHGILLTGWDVRSAVKAAAALPFSEKRQRYLEITDASQIEPLDHVELSLTGLVAKGHECGGWVGESCSFILAQQMLLKTALPIHVRGGIGPQTAAACLVAGAAGVVLDDQLWLMSESPLPPRWKKAIRHLNGSETVLCGDRLGAPVRVLNRPGFAAVELLRRLEEEAEMTGDVQQWVENTGSHLGWGDPATFAWPAGQAIGMAASLARKYHTSGRLVRAIREEALSSVELAGKLKPLAPDAPLARSHGTRYPIVQGPMTRVSDVAPFAAAVAKAGGLPMLALALLRGPQVDRLLRECKELMDGLSWGVGILGFVPPELREEQLAVVHQVRPPFALIAGGRPEHATQLENEGIASYLHVPTPQLLELFIARGSRRFVFEGRECGGHVGPLSSFCLWESMITKLVEVPDKVASEIHVLFAGGIHDERSAAMISALAAPLAARSMKIGVLMGTAYLFTHEAVEYGAIVPRFQQEALKCSRTINLETGPGHAIRCIVTPFAKEFHDLRRQLVREGLDKQTITRKLEELTLGRLRVASKGLRREGDEMIAADETAQHSEGMYMIGQAASMHNGLTRTEELHAGVSEGSIRVLNEALIDRHVKVIPDVGPSDIAIIGISVLLPGAGSLEEYWRNVLQKANCITEIPAHRWDWRLYFDSDKSRRDKIYSKWGGFLDEIPFDPLQFGIPPASLKSIEPMQLLALEATRRALIDAGYENGGFNKESASVILGVSGGLADLGQQFAARSEIPRMFGHASPDVLDRLPEWTGETFPGLLFNIVSGRVANRFDFGGSNYTVDAACASSLAAVDQAVRELECGICDLALAGGVDTMQSPFSYLCFSKTQALSPQGVCRPFDKAADGIVLSEGVGVLVLKRLADAERDGDRIYAVIKAIGSSSDGRGASMTAPTSEGQCRAMRRAYRKAGISPATMGLYEAHGTGTAVGDRIELDSYTTLLTENSAESHSCAVGSVKALVGHSKSAAGVASIVKAAMALYHKTLPAHGTVDNPLPVLRKEESPLYVLDETAPWIGSPGHPRRAAVSAFGFGGTNFHAVLEECDSNLEVPANGCNTWPCELFVWKSNDRDSLIADLEKFQCQIEAADDLTLRELAFSTTHQSHVIGKAALSIVPTSLSELAESVRRVLKELREPMGTNLGPNIFLRIEETPIVPRGNLAFLFPGQGAQYPYPALETTLFIREIAETVKAADAAFDGLFEMRFSKYFYPARPISTEEKKQAAERLSQTQIAQPAIGVISCGYLDFLRRLKIVPDAVAGHSYGEYTALHAAGALTRADFLRLSYLRGQTMAAACEKTPGAMAAVVSSREEVSKILQGTGIRIANHNSPRQTVITGPKPEIEDILEKLRATGISSKLLPVAGAFHSPLMNDAQRPLAEAIAIVPMAEPRCAVFSNTTGLAYPRATEEIRECLSRQMLSSVEFVREIEAMYDAGARIFLEVGPKAILSSLVEDILKGRPDFVSLAVDPARGSLRGLLQTLGKLFVQGVDLDVSQLLIGRTARRLDSELELANRSSQGKAPQWRLSGGCVRTLQEKPGVSTKPSAPTAHDITAERPLLPSENKPTQPIMSAESEASKLGNANPPPVANGSVTPNTQPYSLQAYAAYQETMRQFLKVQEGVMMRLLGGNAMPVESIATEAPVSHSLPPPHSAEYAAGPTPLPANLTSEPSGPPTHINIRHEESTAAAEPPKVSSTENGAIDRESLTNDLLTLVSERTGYPTDMLGLEQDVEADLGIDSIKRVEIFGALQNQLPSDLVARLSEDAEELIRIRTLKGWIDAIMEKSALDGRLAPGPSAAIQEQTPNSEPAFVESETPAPGVSLGRFVMSARLEPLEAPSNGRLSGLYLITLDSQGEAIGKALVSALKNRGASAEILDSDLLPEKENLAAAVAALREVNGPVCGLIHLAGLASLPMPEDVTAWQRVNDTQCKGLFHLLQCCAEELRANGGQILSLSALGGSFGRNADSWIGLPSGAAVVGLLKTLALEWPEAVVQAIDVQDVSPDAVVSAIEAELLNRAGEIEIGYENGRRFVYGAEQISCGPPSEPPPRWAQREDWVVLATGGARGITAESLKEILVPGMTLVIVGRAPEPEPERAVLQDITDPAELRKVFMEVARERGEAATPAMIDKEIRALLRDREICRNLEDFRRMGVKLEYQAADVRDPVKFGSLIDSIYVRYGRINAVLHGAGIIEDKLLVDKTSESFSRVFETKSDSVFTLARHLRPDSLDWLVLFASVAGRTGNRGQCDYAAANELLNRMAWWLHYRWPNVKISSINWGPWESGMASKEINRQFRERGIVPIPPLAGRGLLRGEMLCGDRGPVEIVAGTFHLPKPTPKLPLPRSLPRKTDTGFEYAHTLSLKNEPFLGYHRIDGTPVMPAVGAMELMAEAVQRAWPDWHVCEVHNHRMLRGMLLKDDANLPLIISGTTQQATPSEIHVTADIKPASGPPMPYYGASFVMRREIPSPLDPPPNLPKFDAINVTRADVYKKHAFHGRLFQLVEAIDGLDKRGVSATLRTPPLDEWVSDVPRGSDWLFNPGLLDASTHAGLVWVRTLFETYGLAAIFGRISRYGAPPTPGEIFRLHLLNLKVTEAAAVSEFRLIDSRGKCRLVVENFESTLSKALNRLAPKADL